MKIKCLSLMLIHLFMSSLAQSSDEKSYCEKDVCIKTKIDIIRYTIAKSESKIKIWIDGDDTPVYEHSTPGSYFFPKIRVFNKDTVVFIQSIDSSSSGYDSINYVLVSRRDPQSNHFSKAQKVDSFPSKAYNFSTHKHDFQSIAFSGDFFLVSSMENTPSSRYRVTKALRFHESYSRLESIIQEDFFKTQPDFKKRFFLGEPHSSVISPDGKYYAAFDSAYPTIWVYDLENGATLAGKETLPEQALKQKIQITFDEIQDSQIHWSFHVERQITVSDPYHGSFVLSK